jgi:hypothetical protein
VFWRVPFGRLQVLEGKITFAGPLVSALVRKRGASEGGLKPSELKTARTENGPSGLPVPTASRLRPVGLESVIAEIG